MVRRETLFPIVFLLVSGCEFSVSCGGNKLDRSKMEGFLKEFVAEQTGLEPSRVDCPHDLKSKKGQTIECTVEVGGVQGVFNLVQQDAGGYVKVQSVRGLLIGPKLEGVIAARLLEQTKTKAKVDCGARVRESKPGTKFECRATDPQGATMRIGVTIDDELANVSFSTLGSD